MSGARVQATILLCDAAQSIGGKLYIIGGGWDQLHDRSPQAMALAIKLEVPDELAGRELPLLARMTTQSGDAVVEDEKEITFSGKFAMARHPGQSADAPLTAVFALTAFFHGLTLEPGGYAWELLIDDEPVGRAVFRVI